MGLTDELHPSLQEIEKAAVTDPSLIPAKFAHVKQVSENAVKEIEDLLQEG